MGLSIHIDRGGTFTDAIATFTGEEKEPIIIKLLSEDPQNYKDAPLEAIRRVLEQVKGEKLDRQDKLDTAVIDTIRCGTTVATNSLLERKGERCALVTTKGFKDCLVIGNQTRPHIFDLAVHKPEVLYSTVLEVDERVTLEDYAEDPEHYRTQVKEGDEDICLGQSGEPVRILKRPDKRVIEKELREIFDSGVKSVAVCLAHSYTFPDHEKVIGEVARSIGFSHISLSSDLMPMIKFVPRANSATADAYLSPVVRRYISGFESGFEGGLGSESSRKGEGARCLVDVALFSGLKAILSGPAGGVVGYALTSYDEKTKIPVIGFDMGGTSTDVSRYGGVYEHVFETTTAGVTIQSPQLDINTVAAGGGSRLFWKNGLFAVGPESAGAHPGPVCYRKGGPLTVTDANLLLGRLLPDFFPKIFGPNENESLDIEATRNRFQEFASEINADLAKDQQLSVDEIAYGFIKVANETMARPIRALTEAKGHDTSSHRLATFGGAGGQHSVSIAESLGISQILIHKYSSILSAYGMALADVVAEQQEPSSEVLCDDVIPKLQDRLRVLKERSNRLLENQGFEQDQIDHIFFLNCRYQGTDTSLMIAKPEDSWDYRATFLKQHEQEFSFTLPDRDIIVDDIRVRGTGKSKEKFGKSVDDQMKGLQTKNVDLSTKYGEAQVYFEEGRQKTAIFKLEDLEVGNKVRGPSIIADNTQTIVIPPTSSATILSTHVIIDIGENERRETTPKLSTMKVDPIYLSVFGSRFMAIAEQMGRALQKTSVSTNVKERLDYSCALFDADGGLAANAPHLPVHLGSMSTCVQKQAEIHRGKLKKGDVLLTNHPSYGGTHLPDITAITPHFNGSNIIFYVASRAHHADIGGVLPGSMPPASKEISEEGAVIKSVKLVSEGKFDEESMVQLLLEEPATIPGSSGTRCLRDNISDLKAQVAANQKGINLLNSLIAEYSEEVVLFYMRAIQANAENAVANLLKTVSKRFEGRDLVAEDFMDDGSPIHLRIEIDKEKGTAIFDFEGTGPEMYGNLNSPEAVTFSAVIYCLRCLVSESIPLNQGCLKPVTIKIPRGSLLSPYETAAVVGGNVLTSQRVTDTILRAFDACAASQGDCNNLTFGSGGKDPMTGQILPGFGYYETVSALQIYTNLKIAGGSGAGEDYDGESGVHTHMTNTRITDLEIFERRYPVILREFSIRKGSGGAGKHCGGDGVVRDIEFRIPMTVSILSERRVFHPYGLHGGNEAQCGLNLWMRHVKNAEGKAISRVINLGGKNTARMLAGDHMIVCTPGGGGYGKPSERDLARRRSSTDPRHAWRGKGSISTYIEMQESS